MDGRNNINNSTNSLEIYPGVPQLDWQATPASVKALVVSLSGRTEQLQGLLEQLQNNDTLLSAAHRGKAGKVQ